MKKLNLVELLRGCPSGMELDCTLYNKVTLISVDTNKNTRFPIKVMLEDGSRLTLTKYGQITYADFAKCVIFPKGKTTWEGFVPSCKFKVVKGKWYVCIRDLLDNYANKAFRKGDTYLSTQDGSLIPSNSNVPYKVEHCADEYFRKWTISDAKDGDVLAEDSCIFIIQKLGDNSTAAKTYCTLYNDGGFDDGSILYFDIDSTRLATKEEKERLFQAIKGNGYRWNSETKTLEKLIEPKFKVGDIIKDKNNKIYFVVQVSDKHFDISIIPNAEGYFVPIEDQDEYELVPNKFDIATLTPFDKVLVRDAHSQVWTADLFSHKVKEQNGGFVCIGHYWHQCIPYEGNQHLLGTTNDCDDFYKTW